ncbi:hypothetical protein Q2T40_04785 [Winogradskyella maritima]|nr:hypothetical protein [Winogradskyella maritima]
MIQLNPTSSAYEANGNFAVLEGASGLILNPLQRNDIYLDEARSNRILANITHLLRL